MEHHHFQWKIPYKWPFSIAMLVYQRVLYLNTWPSEVPKIDPLTPQSIVVFPCHFFCLFRVMGYPQTQGLIMINHNIPSGYLT